MIPLISGTFLAARVRALAAAYGYRIERDYRPLALSPNQIFRVDPSWLLAKLGDLRRGLSFIQVGANDGVRCDPIRSYVLRYGWKGVLVEPDPIYFTELQQNYSGVPGLQFLNCAIGDGAEAEFYSISPSAPGYPDWAFGLGSLDKTSILKHSCILPDLERYIQSTKVPVADLNDIAGKYCKGSVDLLVVDAEGYDAEIIQSIDVGRWKPGSIYYESAHLSRVRHEVLLSWFISNGYVVHVGDSDSFALLPELRHSL